MPQSKAGCVLGTPNLRQCLLLSPLVRTVDQCLQACCYCCRVLSSVPVELVPLPESKTIVLPGAWTHNSGGCDLNPYWFKRNPKFVVKPHGSTKLSITLTRMPGKWKRGTPLDNMIGFYIISASDTDGTVDQPAKAIKAETSFVPLAKTTLEYELTSTESAPAFVIVPCTYGPGCKAKFQLSLTASRGGFDAYRLEAVEHSLAASVHNGSGDRTELQL